jgi:uncharacterized protein with PQ loop repeat
MPGGCGIATSTAMSTSQILGAVGTALVVVGYVPQIGHLMRQHCTAGISILAFSLWCLASLLFLVHAAVIRDAVFVVVQAVNLGAGALIVGFCTKYKGEVCPFHRELYRSSERR